MINSYSKWWSTVIALLTLLCCQDRTVKLSADDIKNAIVYVAYSTQKIKNYNVSSKEIYIIPVEDNAKPLRITYNDNWEEQPVWLGSGNFIVFMRCAGRVGSPNSKWYLFSKNLYTSKEERIIEISMGVKVKASENVYILFYSEPNPALYNLEEQKKIIKKKFTSEELGITITGPGSGLWNFDVNKKVDKILVCFTDGARVEGSKLVEIDKFMELAIVNIDGTNFQVLTNDTFPDFAPAISPDGKFIAFESVRERNRDIYIMEIESRKLTRLTEHPADDYSPTWSPDGKRVAFISDRDGHSHIYVINADGTGLFQLTKGEFEVWPGISWSPR
ncbi:MAG: hypothetical protein ABIL18_03300 [candidate division WOR-3 bacterium]